MASCGEESGTGFLTSMFGHGAAETGQSHEEVLDVSAGEPTAVDAGVLDPSDEEALQFYDAEELKLRVGNLQVVSDGIQALSMRCNDMPKVCQDLQVVEKDVRQAAKHMRSFADEESQRPYGDLLKMIDASDRKRLELVRTALKGGHLCGDLLQAVADLEKRSDRIFDTQGKGSQGSNVKFDSKFIEPEIQRLEDVSKDLRKIRDALCEKPEETHSSQLLAAIQEVKNQIWTSDAFDKSKAVLQKCGGWQTQRKQLQLQRGQEQGLLWVAEAERDCFRERLQQATETCQSIASTLATKRAEHAELQKCESISKRELLAHYQDRQGAVESELQQLKKRKEEEEARSKGPIEECQKKTIQLRRDLLSLDALNINHIIIAVDASYSMKGRRWKHLVRAVERFQKACIAQGSQDKVTLIHFNSTASLMRKVSPITTDLADVLWKHNPSGGTAFEPAWQKIRESSQMEPSFARLFVVFLTDGFANDIEKAAKVAEQVFDDASRAGRSMCTFVVHVDDDCSSARCGSVSELSVDLLSPLVKAGNGGRPCLQACGMEYLLLQAVQTDGLVENFERLASFVNLEKCILEARLGFTTAQERELKDKTLKELHELEEAHKKQVNSLRQYSRQVESTMKTDRGTIGNLFKQMLKDMQTEIDSLESRHRQAQDKVCELTKTVRTLEAQHLHLQKSFESSQEEHDKEIASLKDMSMTQLKELEMLCQEQSYLVRRFGTTDVSAISKQLHDLDRLEAHVARGTLLEEDVSCMVHSIVFFTNSLQQQIKEPLPGGTAKISKAKVVLKKLLEERERKHTGRTEEDWPAFLAYEAEMQKFSIDEVCEPVRQAGITAERVCEVVDLTEQKDISKMKDKLIESVLVKACKVKECDTEEMEEVKDDAARRLERAKDELSKKKDDLKDCRRELNELRRESRQSEEGKKEFEEKEKHFFQLQESVNILAESVKTLEAENKDLAAEEKRMLKDQQALRKKLEPCFRIVCLAVDICREAFLEEVAEEEKAALRSTFESFRTNVYQPMQNFISMTRQVKGIFAETPTIQQLATPSRSTGHRGMMTIQDAE